MDTEEDMPRPDELRDDTLAEANALRDLLSQIGDPDAAHDAGVIDDDEYVERKARKLATPPRSPPTPTARCPTSRRCSNRYASRRPSRRRPRPTRRTSTTCS